MEIKKKAKKIKELFNKFIKEKKIKKIIDIIKKKKYIIIAILVVLIVVIILCCSLHKNNDAKPMDEIIDTVNYRKVKTKRSHKTISNKYELKKYKVFETKEDVELNSLTGKILFVRSKNFNANVFQIKEIIEVTDDNDWPVLMQVERNMEYLKSGTLSYIGLDASTKPISEELTGESEYDFPLPLRESVYIEKREYSGTYQALNGDKYDINFYMDGDYLVCELVKFLELNKK